MKKYLLGLSLALSIFWTRTFASQYSNSTTYQVVGNLTADSANQAIIYIKLDAIATPTGSWGINGVSFRMNNTSNNMVKMAKIYFTNSSIFNTSNLLDSIVNPGDTINFQFNLSNLGITSRYLFLTFDIDSNLACNTFYFDAFVMDSSLSITGLGAGLYTPVDPNPSGNRILPNPTLTPSLTISADTIITCLSDTVNFTATAINGGALPIFKWYKNGTLRTTNSTGVFSINSLDTGDVIYCKLLSSFPCINASPVSSNSIIVNFPILLHEVVLSSNGMQTQDNLILFTALSNNGGTSPNYQWYRNGFAVGIDKNTFLDSTLVSGDKIYCSVASNSSCITPAMVSSDTITVVFSTLERSRSVALLDLGPENQETNGSNLYSASHMLDVAGISYKVVTDIFEAQNYKMVVGSSTVGNGVFSSDEHVALRNYVRSGGILFSIRLKDPDLFTLFGITNFDTRTDRRNVYFNMLSADADLAWFNDTLEQSISLGDTSAANVIETLGYSLGTATNLGFYDDGKVCLSKNNYGTGYAYNFGISLKEIIFRNQVNKDYDAEREYTNAFEPTTDVLFLLMRAIYTSHINFGVWKHTSPGNSKSTLIVTHDIDALSSVNLMQLFANYEDSLKMGSTYFMTVHYENDLISAFYDSSITDLNLLVTKNRSIASHSIGHFSDMDDSTIVLTGTSGNTRSNYHPANNGGATTNATIWGELEVSKNLLQADCNTTVRSFRPGYLLVHPKQMKTMDTLNYEFSSSYTAPDVLTNFPYFIHEDKSFQSRLTTLLEIPIATSDVVRDFILDSLNYPLLVTKWKHVYEKNHANSAPTVLLIHPTRTYKLAAQRSFVNQLPSGSIIKSMEDFGDFWKARNNSNFSTELIGNNLKITLLNLSLAVDSNLSFIVNNGQILNSIQVVDQNNSTIAYTEANWIGNSKIIYLKPENLIGINEIKNKNKNSDEGFKFSTFPNPFSNSLEFEITLKTSSNLSLSLYTISGVFISKLVDGLLQDGVYKKTYDSSLLAEGIYFYELRVNEKTKYIKIVLMR
ncbi:MAG TPA: T9SS type A sorting domain-containing protein [Bacteroidia bacterium]|nr:T9SS type A sorting domain-containing protein [Bacteroidia bacterium]